MSATSKTCKCCGTVYQMAMFMALPPPPSARYPNGIKAITDGEIEVTEIYRNCVCGSTLVVIIEEHANGITEVFA